MSGGRKNTEVGTGPVPARQAGDHNGNSPLPGVVTSLQSDIAPTEPSRTSSTLIAANKSSASFQ